VGSIPIHVENNTKSPINSNGRQFCRNASWAGDLLVEGRSVDGPFRSPATRKKETARRSGAKVCGNAS